jgi:signal transduction histidine kinase
LAQQLAQREQELQATHQALRSVEQRQTVLLERQRLVRDMHDGIGSSLMSSLTVAEGQNAEPAQIAWVLHECLDDLKLVIESLEPLEHDLPTLLGALRHRFGYRLEAAGLEVQWEMTDLPELPWLDAPQALQIMRLLQEVLANVIKHAKASCVRVETTLAVDSGGSAQVVLCLQDDGMGFDTAQAATGRGLTNMQARATIVGGTLTPQSLVGAGTIVALRLPVHQAPEDLSGVTTHPRTNNVTSGTSPT